MKVLYVITSGDGGGAQRYVLELAGHFKGMIASGTENRALEAACNKNKIPYHPVRHLVRSLHPWHDFLALIELYTLIGRLKPDIVHTNSSKAGVLGSIAGKLRGKKVIFTAHGMYYFNAPSAIRRTLFIIAEWLAARFQDRIITVSDHDREAALTHKLRIAEEITTIHNAIPASHFIEKAGARSALGIPKDTWTIGTIANYYGRKDLATLIQSIALLPENVPIYCVLIGEGPERQKLSQLISSLKVGGKVHLFGSLQNAHEYLRAFDTFVLSSQYEGFPYVLLEALAAHVPIIATSAGGNSEVIGKAGLLIPPKNPAQLADALQRLYNDPLLQRQLKARTEEQEGKFSLQKMLNKTDRVYRSVSKNS